MIVIGLDSSTKNLNMGIYGEGISMGKKYDTFRLNVEKIDYYLMELIKEAGIKLSEANAFCVTNGPGSYSGLRVGSAFIKGMSFGRHTEFVSVSTVYAMIFHYREYKRKVGVVYDIKHDKLVFMDNMDFKEIVIDKSNVGDIEWSSYELVGNGVKSLKENFNIEDLSVPKEGNMMEPLGEDVAHAGYLAIKNGHGENIVYFEPRYFK